MEFQQRVNKLALVRYAAYDSEMSQVANMVSQHVTELIYAQYSFALSTISCEFYEDWQTWSSSRAPFATTTCGTSQTLPTTLRERVVRSRVSSCRLA